MTVQDTTPSVTHVGDGIDVSFPFTFRVDDIAWLSVDFVTNFDQFLLNADQDASPGGSAEYTVAPPNLQELTILRTTAKTQLLDYTRYDPFDSESHEDALDKLTMLIQDTCFSFEDHILDTDIHFSDAPADGMYYSRRNNAWEVNPIVAGPFDHMALINIGSNDHFAIDAHIANTSIHFGDALANGIIFGRQNNAWVAVPTDDPWIEFIAVAGNPGGTPANTLFMDDGTLHDPNTVAMGDLTVPMLLTTNVGFGDPGTEQGGINVGGVTFDAHVKINDIGGSLDATFILHRHSSANPPIMVFARTASDTAAHIAVAASDTLASFLFTGWSGTHYDIAAVLDIRVPAGSTVSPTSLPSEMLFYTVPDLSNTAALALQLNSDQSVRMSDAYTFPVVDGLEGQVLVTDGAGGLAFGSVSAGLLSGQYRFSSSTVAADPGPGRFRYDTGAYGTVTQIFIDDVTNQGVDISNILALITTDDRLYIQGEDDGDEFAVWNVTAPATDNGGWFTIDVALEASGVFLGNNDRVLFVLQIGGASAGVSDHGALTGLVPDDDHTQYLLLAGRSGGQVAFGSTLVNEDLTLDANPVAGVNTGRIVMRSAVEFESIAETGAPYAFNYNATEVFPGNFVGGGLNMSGNITTGGATFIYESFRGAPTITTAFNPGFAAYTVLQALPALVAGSGAGHNPLNPLILNAGPRVNNPFSGTRTAATMGAINWSPTVQASVSGAVMNAGSITGLINAPKWSTVAGSTINFGTIRAVHCQNPAVGLFQPGAGTEIMTAYIGLDCNNITFGTASNVRAVVRSAMQPSSVNTWFLLNNGNAHSDHGAGHIYFDDNAGIAYGGVSNLSFDVWQTWNGAGNYFRTFFSANADSLRWSNPNADRFLFDSDGGNTAGEYNFNCAKFSMGAQTGAVGNQVGVFVTGARSTGLGGEWSDFLLTQAANLTVDHAMGGVFGWTINAPSMTIGTGSVTTAGALNVGGNVNQGSVNRFGIRVISNPSGGSGVNAALWITAGLSRFDGRVDINNGIALGGGAVPTLGTIGGAGPTAAAQAQWVEIDIGGVAHWIPAWT